MSVVFVCQAEDGIRDLVRSRGLGDVYKRQLRSRANGNLLGVTELINRKKYQSDAAQNAVWCLTCLLYTSDAADERSSVDLGGRRIIKKKKW